MSEWSESPLLWSLKETSPAAAVEIDPSGAESEPVVVEDEAAESGQLLALLASLEVTVAVPGAPLAEARMEVELVEEQPGMVASAVPLPFQAVGPAGRCFLRTRLPP